MKVKEYLINLWNKIKTDETGQWDSWQHLLHPYSKPTKNPYGGSATTVPTTYGSTKSSYGGSATAVPTTYGSTKSQYGGSATTVPTTYRKTPTPQQVQTTPTYTQPQTPNHSGYTGGGGGGITDISIGQPPVQDVYVPPDWNELVPQQPSAPQVTAQMIAEWLSRATTEGGLMYDPQSAGIGRELETSLLASEQSKGSIPGYYQDIINAIQDWQKTTTEEEQRRWYARGLGQGGGLIEAEKGISESALKETTKAETEKARILTEITQQEELLKKQAGQKTTEIEVARSQYITSRSAELRDTYERNQTQISQQRYQNQLEAAKFGFTAETQNFQNYLQQQELKNDTWYKTQLLDLEKKSMSISSAAQAEALQWEKEQASTLSAYQKATLAQSGGTGAGTGSNMFTIPGTNHKITVQQAINAGYVKPGQYADKPEPSVWDFIAGGGDTSDVKALATFMSTGKITSTPNTPISNTVPASKYRYAGYGTAADSKW